MIVISTDVFCDGHNCDQWDDTTVTGQRAAAREARANAKSNGWVRRGTKDLCPDCKTKA